jgi:hypothetical protein
MPSIAYQLKPEDAFTADHVGARFLLTYEQSVARFPANAGPQFVVNNRQQMLSRGGITVLGRFEDASHIAHTADVTKYLSDVEYRPPAGFKVLTTFSGT